MRYVKHTKWLFGTVFSCLLLSGCSSVQVPVVSQPYDQGATDGGNQAIYSAVMHAHYLGFKGDVTGGMDEFDKVIAIYPRNVDLRYQYGKFLIDYAFRVQNQKVFQEFLTSAKAQLEEAVVLDPENKKVRHLTAEVCMELGQLDEAVNQLTSILKTFPNEADTRVMLARLLIHRGTPSEAVNLLAEYTSATSEESAEFLKVYALACGESGRLLEAIEYYDSYLEYFPGEFEATYNLALCLFRSEQLIRAEDLLQGLVERGEMTTDVAELLIDILRSQGRHLEAVDLLKQLALEPRYEVGAKIEIGQIFLGLNEPGVAYDYLISAVSRDPNNKRATFFTSVALMEKGEYQQALRILENNLEDKPLLVTVADLAMDLLMKLERPTMALKLSERTVKENPDNSRAYILRAGLLSTLAQDKMALITLEDAIKRFPEDAQVVNALAFKLEQQGQWRKAIEVIEPLFEKFPDNPEIANFIGYTLADYNEDLDRAHLLIEQALQREPDNPAYQDSMGWVLFRLGKFERALTHLEQSFLKMSNDAVVLSHYIQTLIELNRLEEAENVLIDGLRQHPTDQGLTECRRLLNGKK